MPLDERIQWDPRKRRETSGRPPPVWPIPDTDTMRQRQEFRRRITQENDVLRRIHPHGGLNTRNIVFVLDDRQVRGGMSRRLPRAPPPSETRKGDRSPATVFESPVSTTMRLYSATNDTTTREENPAEEDAKSEEQASPKEGPLQRQCYPLKVWREIQSFTEYCSVTKYHSAFLQHLGGKDGSMPQGQRPASSCAVSTISIAFSPDALTMASTHGDHTVKISCCNTGRLLQSLEGHARTPWTVKYHPSDSRIVASGCLGHQVRVWNWTTKTCLQMVRLEYAIISLSFHPSGRVLAVANGTRLHFWGVNDFNSKATDTSTKKRDFLTEVDQRHMLRCVHFPPNGTTLIIGGVNPTADDPRRRNRVGGMSFYLRLWDFDLNMAMQPLPYSSGINIPRRAISNPRTFVPRALLYNDGGFDVSPDGKKLCACAEYWLPDDVDSAMELKNREEMAYEAESRIQGETCEKYSGMADCQSAISKAVAKLRTVETHSAQSPPFQDSTADGNALGLPSTPTTSGNTQTSFEFVPRTPENTRPESTRLSPPPPPGRNGLPDDVTPRRLVVSTAGSQLVPEDNLRQGTRGLSTPPPPPPPPAPGIALRPPHPLSMLNSPKDATPDLLSKGRYVPHVVTISLDTTPIPDEHSIRLQRGKAYGAVAKGYQPRLGQLLEACPLDPNKASAVTCVKFSPSTDYCLIGYGVREPVTEGDGPFHPVTALYRINGGMTHVSTMLSGDDDVNIARFHPDSGYGFVYGTKQGRVRVQSTRPWMYYNYENPVG